MNPEILGIVAMFVITLLLALPLGKYMAKVFSNEPTFLDPLFNPIERAFFKISGIDASQEQTWKQQMMSMLTINLVWFLLGMLIPFALIFALGYFLNRKKFAWSIFAVMTIGFFLLTIPTIYNEMNGNSNITKMGIDNSMGAMEGKELRFGVPASAY